MTTSGATESDYPVSDDNIKCESVNPASTAHINDDSTPSPETETAPGAIGVVTLVQCTTGIPGPAECPPSTSPVEKQPGKRVELKSNI